MCKKKNILLGDGPFELQERGLQLTDVPVERFDFTLKRSRSTWRQPRMPVTSSPTRRCGSIGSEHLWSRWTRAAVAAAAAA